MVLECFCMSFSSAFFVVLNSHNGSHDFGSFSLIHSRDTHTNYEVNKGEDLLHSRYSMEINLVYVLTLPYLLTSLPFSHPCCIKLDNALGKLVRNTFMV